MGIRSNIKLEISFIKLTIPVKGPGRRKLSVRCSGLRKRIALLRRSAADDNEGRIPVLCEDHCKRNFWVEIYPFMDVEFTVPKNIVAFIEIH